MGGTVLFELFVGYLTLTYHEARNVRHIINYMDRQRYEQIIRSLARDRDEAWSQIQPERQAAAATGDVEKAVTVLEDRFGLTLEDLQELYLNENWRHASGWGGNKWAGIARAVREAYEVLRSGDHDSARNLLRDIGLMHHNNGIVSEKLERLDSSLAPG